MIRNAFIQANLPEEPRRTDVKKLLKDYVVLRRESTELNEVPEEEQLAGLLEQGEQIQHALMFILGFDITAVLAGLGVGGIAVALALQKPMDDVIGLYSCPVALRDSSSPSRSDCAQGFIICLAAALFDPPVCHCMTWLSRSRVGSRAFASKSSVSES